jgi:hypothetical protein
MLSPEGNGKKRFAQRMCRGGGVRGERLWLGAANGVISKRDEPALAIRLKSWGWSAITS